MSASDLRLIESAATSPRRAAVLVVFGVLIGFVAGYLCSAGGTSGETSISIGPPNAGREVGSTATDSGAKSEKRAPPPSALTGNGSASPVRENIASNVGSNDAPARLTVAVPVAVALPDGHSAKRANVEVVSADGSATIVWSAEDPAIGLVVGPSRVRASIAPDQCAANGVSAELVSEWRSVDVDAGSTPLPLELRLGPRRGIRGRVTLGEGLDLREARVLLRGVPPGTPDTPEDDAPVGYTDQVRIEVGSGEFEFLDLAAGRYELRVFVLRLSRPVARDFVVVADSIARLDLCVGAIEFGSRLVVRATGSRGESIEVSNVRARLLDGTSVWMDDLSGWSDRQAGFVAVATDRIGEFLDGTRPECMLEFIVEAAGYGRRTIQVAPRTSEVEVVFGSAARLSVEVVADPRMAASGGIHVDLLFAADLQSKFPAIEDTEYLRFGRPIEFGPLQPGEYEARLGCSAYSAPRAGPLVVERVVVEPGENRFRMVAPALYRLTARVAANLLEEGDDVELSLGDETTYVDLVDGVAVFEGLSPGEYTLTYDDNDLIAEQVVAVPAVTEVALVPKRPDALRVHIYDLEGDLARLGYLDRDLIVGFDGTECTTTAIELDELVPGETMKVSVLRGSQRLEIVTEVVLLRGVDRGGGWLAPASR